MKLGDHVHVASLGNGIVREIRKGGRCLVEIKGRSLLVDAQQLSPVDVHRSTGGIRRAPATSGAAQPGAAAQTPNGPHAAASIDLHGMRADEAVDALDRFLNDAILAGRPEVRVIHGRSGGRLKAAVHGRLKGMPSIGSYRIDPVNPGVTIVIL